MLYKDGYIYMANVIVEIIGLLYLILFFIYTTLEIVIIKKKKKLYTISFVRLLYAFIYGLVPSLALLTGYSDHVHLYYIDYSQDGVLTLFFWLMFSIIGYGCMNLGYIINFLPNRKIKKADVKQVNNLYIAAVVTLLIGFISLLLWTKVFGSPFGILPYASEIRSGDTKIYNPFTFFKHPSALLMFSSYIFFVILEDEKYKKFLTRIITWILFIFSVFWASVYNIANDGRLTLILYFAVFFLYKAIGQKKRIPITKFIIIGAIAFILMSISNVLIDYIKFGTFGATPIQFDLINMILHELGYTLRSQQVAFFALANHDAGTRIVGDLMNGLFAWLPTMLKPFEYMSLFKYNTLLSGYTTGTLPTDFLSMCIYDLGIVGIVIFPLALGFIVKKIDKYFDTRRNQNYFLILQILVSAWFALKIIAYADFENIMRSSFFIIIGQLIVKSFNLIRLK